MSNIGKGRGRQVIAVARTADLILMMLDAVKGDVQRLVVYFWFLSAFSCFRLVFFKHFYFVTSYCLLLVTKN